MICGSGPCFAPTPDARELAELEGEIARRELVALNRALLTRSLDAFTRWAWPLITSSPLAPNKATDAIIATLQRVADGELTRVLIALPPGVGKSKLLACYAAWRLARDPWHRAIHVGHAAGLAETESRRVRRLVEGDEFRAVFGVKLRDDENTAAHWATDEGGRYIAVGTDGALLGRRADEAILDDPLDGNDRWSKPAKQRLVEWFFGSLSTRLDGIGAIVVVQQRLCRDDLIGVLAEFESYTLVSLPAEDEEGNLLAPEILTRDKLDEQRERSPSNYSCMYLQRPSDDANAAVPRTWWRFHRPAHVAIDTSPPLGCNADAPAIPTPDTFDAQAITVDMTFGGVKRTNDFACIQVWGRKRSPTGKQLFCLLHQWRKRASQLEQRKALRAIMASFPRAKVFVEKAAGGAGAIEELISDGIPVEPIQPLGSKETRLGMYASAPIEEGRVLLPLGASYLPELVEELAGGTGHDDSQDCLVYACAILGAQRPTVWDTYRQRADRGNTGEPPRRGRGPGGFGNVADAILGRRQPALLPEHVRAPVPLRSRRR
ncbi:hypothetical protein BH11MYX3_BH11MYX3_04670 [soil metagenome]